MEGDRENVFLRCFTDIVSVAYCGDDLEDPVESKNVLSVIWLLIEILIILKGPRVCACRIKFLLRFDVFSYFFVLGV